MHECHELFGGHFGPAVHHIDERASDEQDVSGTTPDQYSKDLKMLAEWALEDGAREVILLTPPLWQSWVYPNPVVEARNALLVDYVPEIESICLLGEEITCGPDVQSLLIWPDHYLDAVHANAIGHQVIADALAPYVVPEVPTMWLGLPVALGVLGWLRSR